MTAESCRVHKLVADVALFAEEHVLLVRYQDTSRYDGQQGWFLPDDYLVHLEHPEDAARRILREQAGKNIRALQWFPLRALPERLEVAHGGWGLDVLEVVLRQT